MQRRLTRTPFRSPLDRAIAASRAARAKRAASTSFRRSTSMVPRRAWAPGSRTELKSIDLDLATTGSGTGDITTTMGRTCANAISIGADINQRVGRKITIRSLEMHYSVFADADQVDPTLSRIMVVFDRQANGTQPAGTDILTASTVYSPKNLNNRERFTILKDDLISTQRLTDKSQVVQKWYLRTSLPVVYNSGVAGTYADIASGSLWVCVVSTVAVDYPLLKGFLRVRYSDE